MYDGVGGKRRRGKMVANPAPHRVGGTCIIFSFSFPFFVIYLNSFFLLLLLFFLVGGRGRVGLGYGRVRGKRIINLSVIAKSTHTHTHTHTAIHFGGGAPGVIESEGVRNRTER